MNFQQYERSIITHVISTMTIKETNDRIIREFATFSNWKDKYMYIIDLGKKLPLIAESEKNESNLLHGCMSRVWIMGELQDGKVHFTADSDGAIVKGLVALMIRFYGDRTPDEILQNNPDFLQEIGMDQHFSMTRANGLKAMLKQIKIYAVAFKHKLEGDKQ